MRRISWICAVGFVGLIGNACQFSRGSSELLADDKLSPWLPARAEVTDGKLGDQAHGEVGFRLLGVTPEAVVAELLSGEEMTVWRAPRL